MADAAIDLSKIQKRLPPEFRLRVIKAASPQESAVLTTDEVRVLKEFSEAGALTPPYDLGFLSVLFELSNSLRQNVDAYVTNIDSFGHRFEPVIDLEADDAKEAVRNAMLLERIHEQESATKPADADDLAPIDDEAIESKIEELRERMRRERARAEAFFSFCCVGESFISLRRKTRQDLETMGNGAWEVLRNQLGQPVRLSYVPFQTVRLLPFDKDLTEIAERVRSSPMMFTSRKIRRRFRRYMQRVDNRTVFFKEFGDPRIVSNQSGNAYPSVATMRKTEGKEVGPATELWHFDIHSPRGPYGVPRWIGALLSVLGSRQAEEINESYFDNKSIPPLAILCSGGRLSQSTVDSLTDFINEEIRGKGNFHKIAILEAEPFEGDTPENAAKAQIKIQPLTQAQVRDGLFMKYDERNMDKVGMTFRLPRLLRGDVRDFNRATAQSALEFAETQVFEPERNEFDWLINRQLMTALGIALWRFRSNGPIKRDPEAVAERVERLVKVGVLTPAEGREIVADAFGRDLPSIKADWVKQPLQLTLAGIPVEQPPALDKGLRSDAELAREIGQIIRTKRLVEDVEDALDRRDLLASATREAVEDDEG